MATITLKLEQNYDGEFRVAVYQDSEFREGPTYYTDDKKDAQDTAQFMAKEYDQVPQNNVRDLTGKVCRRDWE